MLKRIAGFFLCITLLQSAACSAGKPIHLVNIAEMEQYRQADGGKVILKFYANWCGPCRIVQKFIEKLLQDARYQDIVVIEIDTDNASFAGLTSEFNVRALPTIVFLENGSVLKVRQGAPQEYEAFRAMIDEIYASNKLANAKKAPLAQTARSEAGLVQETVKVSKTEEVQKNEPAQNGTKKKSLR